MAVQTADAVVIGAGINGAATAYNLVRRGLEKVVLIEKQLLASGGTGRSAAIIRQHYSNRELVQLVRRSVEIFHNFQEAVGGDPGFVNTGWAFLVPDYASEGLDRNLALSKEVGVDVREISRDELHELEPRIDLSDVARIAYEPASGYADPAATTYCYVKRFTELGGELRQLTAVRGLIANSSGVRGVRTDQGDIAAGAVVNAAGPWAPGIAKCAGLDVPIRVTREEEIVLETVDVGGPPRLCFSDMAQAIYYRPHQLTRTLLGRGYPKPYQYVEPDGYNQEVDAEFIAETTRRFHHRWPSFTAALQVGSYTGLYDVTPDWHPILGPVDGVDGFYLCAGFSGHGFKIGPAVGEVMAELVAEGRSRGIDVSRLNLSRFAEGKLLSAAYGGNRA